MEVDLFEAFTVVAFNNEYQKAIEKSDKGKAVGIALFRATIRRIR